MNAPPLRLAAGRVRLRFCAQEADSDSPALDQLEVLARCLLDEAQPEEIGAQVLKTGRVWRLGDKVIKRYASKGLKDRLRASTAMRVARLHKQILPTISPLPRVVLELPSGFGTDGSMLIMDWVPGQVLTPDWGVGRVLAPHWSVDDKAQAALGPFVADLHMRKIFHGDFHMGNLIWTGEEYVLLDIESLRPAWAVLQPQRLFRRHWSRIVMDLGSNPAVEAAYGVWLAKMGLAWTAEDWLAIVREGERTRAVKLANS